LSGHDCHLFAMVNRAIERLERGRAESAAHQW